MCCDIFTCNENPWQSQHKSSASKQKLSAKPVRQKEQILFYMSRATEKKHSKKCVMELCDSIGGHIRKKPRERKSERERAERYRQQNEMDTK